MFKVVPNFDEDSPNPSDVLSSMRDRLVSDIRRSLLTGVFMDRPEDLEVSGNVSNNVIMLSVRDTAKSLDFSKSIPVAEFLGARGGDWGDSDAVASADNPQEVLDSPLTSRVSLKKRITEDEFKNVKRLEDSREDIIETSRQVVSQFVSEYLRVKAET